MDVVEKHKRDKYGELQDAVRMDPATASDRDAYVRAVVNVGRLEVPLMFTSSNPHARLYVANFDGTGNDKENDPEHATNVALLHEHLRVQMNREPRIRSDYVKGAGTQDDAVSRLIDGATGKSYGGRIEEMYSLFAKQARRWIDADPGADIRLVATGFSRGAEQAAGFVRLVNERGIQDYDGRLEVRQALGRDKVFWTLPALRAPGTTLTSEILFDPVGTGTTSHYDRQPTSSTVSAIQITARDERRNAFPSTQILPPGRSADGRFVGVIVPGAHSDIGGSYHRNGLSTLNFNLAADFLNAHSDVPLVIRLPEPTDPRMYVIHHSEDHMWFYRTSEFKHDGHRDVMGSQASPPHCREVIVCAPPDPFDPRLEPMVGPRVSIRERDAERVHDLRDEAHPDHAMFRHSRVQVLELHVRHGFDLNPEQVDRLATGLVIEAKRHGMKSIQDVQFGTPIGPEHPSLRAFSRFPGNVDDPRSRSASIDALKALGVPMDVSNQQLHQINHRVETRRESERVRSVPAQDPGVSMSRSYPATDPRHAANPHHRLFTELRRRVPDASEDRLLQFTAVCRTNGVTVRNLVGVRLYEDNMTLGFCTHDPMATPARIDLRYLPPQPSQSIEQIRQSDELAEQIAQIGRERSARMAQQGPVR